MRKHAAIPHPDVEPGFTLIEVLIAVAVITAGLMTVAQLTLLTSRANDASREVGFATALAAQKLGEFQSSPAGSLPTTAADAWLHASPGAFEYLDRAGRLVGQSSVPPDAAVYVRRWAIRPVTGTTDPRVAAIEVSVGRITRLSSGALADATGFDVVRLSSVQIGLVP